MKALALTLAIAVVGARREEIVEVFLRPTPRAEARAAPPAPHHVLGNPGVHVVATRPDRGAFEAAFRARRTLDRAR